MQRKRWCSVYFNPEDGGILDQASAWSHVEFNFFDCTRATRYYYVLIQLFCSLTKSDFADFAMYLPCFESIVHTVGQMVIAMIVACDFEEGGKSPFGFPNSWTGPCNIFTRKTDPRKRGSATHIEELIQMLHFLCFLKQPPFTGYVNDTLAFQWIPLFHKWTFGRTISKKKACFMRPFWLLFDTAIHPILREE